MPALGIEAGQAGRCAVDGRLPRQWQVLFAVVAAATSGLHPGGADAIAHLARVDTGAHLDNLAHDFVAGDQWEKVTRGAARGPHVGEANPARVHFDQHLAGSCGRCRDLAQFPCGIDLRDNGGLHLLALLVEFLGRSWRLR